MSRLDKGKRNDEIIRIFSKVKDRENWHLYILGDGEEYKHLESLIKELHLEGSVSLEGYISKEKLPDYLLNSSIFLMASITEGLPMVLLEAMSYGIPCIAYEIPSGVNDIIEHNQNGFVIKNRNEEEYIKCLERLMKDSKLRKKFGHNTNKKVEEFKKETILKKWYSILK